MKKVLYFIMIMVVASAFCACSDDDDNVYTFANAPEIDAQGTYEGTYLRVTYGTTDSMRAEGTIVLAPADTAYTALARFSSAEFKLDKSVVLNISHANEGFVLFNNSTLNSIGQPVTGRIDNNKQMKIQFQLSQRVGRQTNTYIYYFTGKKQ